MRPKLNETFKKLQSCQLLPQEFCCHFSEGEIMRNAMFDATAKVLSLVALSLIAGCDDGTDIAAGNAPSPARPVKTVTITDHDALLRFQYPVVVAASQEVALSFRVPGKLNALLVGAGDTVKAGQPIAQLDTRDFNAQVAQLTSQLTQARAQLAAMTSGARSEDLASARAELAGAKAQFNAAQAQARRTVELYKKGISARAAVDRDMASLRVAHAQVKVQQQLIAKSQSGARTEDREAQQAMIDGILTQIEMAQNAVNDTVLRAPFDGVIADRKVDNFANVQAKEVIVTLQSEAGLELILDVPGADIIELARDPNPKGIAQLDNAPDHQFQARLVEFSSEPDATTNTYRTRVAIDRPDNIAILSGMTGRLDVTIAAGAPSKLAIPAAAVAGHPDGSAFVWTVSDRGLVEKRDVALGAATASDVPVLKGLSPGDEIVVAGVSQLMAGMAVRPMTAEGK